jgi:hypothetical protein
MLLTRRNEKGFRLRKGAIRKYNLCIKPTMNQRVLPYSAAVSMLLQAKILVTCLDGHSRSKMSWYLLLMYQYGLIEDSDLEAFSDELREWILAVT